MSETLKRFNIEPHGDNFDCTIDETESESGNWVESEQALLIINALTAQLAAMQTERDNQQKVLDHIQRWSQAYPLEVFPEPDMMKAHFLLNAGGMTLDAISASNMRHVLTGVLAEIEALEVTP